MSGTHTCSHKCSYAHIPIWTQEHTHVNTKTQTDTCTYTSLCTNGHTAHVQCRLCSYLQIWTRYTPQTERTYSANSLVMVWPPPLVHINANNHTVHTCTHRSLRCAKWKLCVRASSRTAQLPAMSATLSKPNGHSEQQHCVWRVVHSRAFWWISGTFCLSGYACQSVREPAGRGEWRGFVHNTMNMTSFA